ncbi:unnamed protein product [Moneuplotes crassus]|uniref:Uncharacterized protein n=1 Tax=Euplotes crassus TaxID=5936 RepID=A0AAD1UQ56_EUPCR|nr:unnamed protein product [Moneuplotes crassus]
MKLDRNSLAIIFSYLSLKERIRILLFLCHKTRAEVYSICTTDLLLSHQLYDFSNKKTTDFVQQVVISNLSLVKSIVFDSLDLKNVEYLADLLAEIPQKKLERTETVCFQDIIYQPQEDNENEFNNIQELVKDGINKLTLDIQRITFSNCSGLVCSWVLTFIEIPNLRSIEITSISCSFVELLSKIFKRCSDFESLKIINCKVNNKSKLRLLNSSLAQVLPNLKEFAIINSSIQEFLGETFTELIPRKMDPGLDLMDRKKLSLESLALEDETLSRS